MELAQIWRYPIKAMGRERLEEVALCASCTLPLDRQFAVSRQGADLERNQWARCGNFLRGASLPTLNAIECQCDAEGKINLSHPIYGAFHLVPDDEDNVAGFIEWVSEMCEGTRLAPQELLRLDERGFTDTQEPTISIMNLASLDDFNQKSDANYTPERWRGNLWLEGFEAWSECDWVGNTLKIGEAEIKIIDEIERCQMPSASPSTGHRDSDAPGLLRQYFDTQNFGVYGVVGKAGTIAQGDKVEFF